MLDSECLEMLMCNQIAKMEKGAALDSNIRAQNGDSQVEYDLVGDIIWAKCTHSEPTFRQLMYFSSHS